MNWGRNAWGFCADLLPNAGVIAALVNPTNPNAESVAKDLLAAAQSMGLTLNVLHVSSERDIDGLFATLVQRRASAFLTVSDPLFTSRRQQIAVLAANHKIPAIYHVRDFTAAGGLMSYAPNIYDVFRQAGVYTGRILKGEKARRPAGGAANQVRVRDQPQDRQGARLEDSADAARPRR